MKISKQTFQKTGAWIKRYARPLEAARWEYLFENGSKEKVIHYLSAYQNEDGGFGHGIEPDFWLPSSSPMATWAAGQVLMEIDVDPNEEIVQSMISYLTNTPQIEVGMWPSVLPENNHHPHAPWWHWREDVQKNWMFNPSAELAAFLVAYSPKQSEAEQLGWSTLQKAIQRLIKSTEMDRHEINNYQKLIKLMIPYEEVFNTKIGYSLKDIQEKVRQLINDCVDRDVMNWLTGYKALPLDFIEHPNETFNVGLEELVEQNIIFYIKQMSNEGIWDISWSWEQYPEQFAIARQYWKGILAIRRYSILKSFDCIELDFIKEPFMKEKVIKAYNELAIRYEREGDTYNIYNTDYERPAMIEQLPNNLVDLEVLDAGSAAGWYTQYLINQGAIVTAIDISPKMVAATKQRTKEAEVLLCDLSEKLPFKDNTYDIIVSSLTLHYIKDWEYTFSEFYRILKPNGIFLFSVHHPIMDISISKTKKYFDTELLTDYWKKGDEEVEVVFYRRPLYQIINTTSSFFNIEKLIEPKPTERFRSKAPEAYGKLMQRPNFLIIKSINSKKKYL